MPAIKLPRCRKKALMISIPTLSPKAKLFGDLSFIGGPKLNKAFLINLLPRFFISLVHEHGNNIYRDLESFCEIKRNLINKHLVIVIK